MATSSAERVSVATSSAERVPPVKSATAISAGLTFRSCLVPLPPTPPPLESSASAAAAAAAVFEVAGAAAAAALARGESLWRGEPTGELVGDSVMPRLASISAEGAAGGSGGGGAASIMFAVDRPRLNVRDRVRGVPLPEDVPPEDLWLTIRGSCIPLPPWSYRSGLATDAKITSSVFSGMGGGSGRESRLADRERMRCIMVAGGLCCRTLLLCCWLHAAALRNSVGWA